MSSIANYLKLILKAGVLAVAVTVAASATPSQAEGVKIGILKCTVAKGVGLIITSNKSLSCRFKRSNGKTDHYTGNIRKYGLDIGVTKKTYIAWAVFAAAESRNVPGVLAGSYGGVTAEVTVAGGLGANVLVGGSRKSIALQPLSVQAQTGLNIAVGIGSMTLNYAR